MLKPDIESLAVTVKKYYPGLAAELILYWEPFIDKQVGRFYAENWMLVADINGIVVIVGKL